MQRKYHNLNLKKKALRRNKKDYKEIMSLYSFSGDKNIDDYTLLTILCTLNTPCFTDAFNIQSERIFVEKYIKAYGEESYLDIKNNPESMMKKYSNLITPKKNE